MLGNGSKRCSPVWTTTTSGNLAVDSYSEAAPTSTRWIGRAWTGVILAGPAGARSPPPTSSTPSSTYGPPAAIPTPRWPAMTIVVPPYSGRRSSSKLPRTPGTHDSWMAMSTLVTMSSMSPSVRARPQDERRDRDAVAARLSAADGSTFPPRERGVSGRGPRTSPAPDRKVQSGGSAPWPRPTSSPKERLERQLQALRRGPPRRSFRPG